MAEGMNEPLYTREILRLAASIPHLGRSSELEGATELRSPICGSRMRMPSSSTGRTGRRACARRSGLRLGQASAALMGAHAIGRSAEELGRGADRARRLAWPGQRRSRHAWPGLERLRRRWSRRAATARSCCRSGRCSRRSRRPGERRSPGRRGDQRACSSGAIMLGAALVFVLLFRQLGLGATLGYLVAGALIGPHVLGLIDDPEEMAASPKSASSCCCSSSGSSSSPSGCGGCARTFSGSAWSRSCCAASRSACSSTSRSASRRPPRSRSACRWLCPRPRRCCRCCAPTMSSTRRSASAPSRSCCSRTCRSCR